MQLHITKLGVPKDRQTQYGIRQTNYLVCDAPAEHKDKFLNFWVNTVTKYWKIGDTIEIEGIEQKPYTAKDGTQKVSWNIKLPAKDSVNAKVLENIYGEITKLNLKMETVIGILRPPVKEVPMIAGTDIPYPEEDINPDDIPF